MRKYLVMRCRLIWLGAAAKLMQGDLMVDGLDLSLRRAFRTVLTETGRMNICGETDALCLAEQLLESFLAKLEHCFGFLFIRGNLRRLADDVVHLRK